jgi:hypothetical protein
MKERETEKKWEKLRNRQGGQIGRIFAQWAIVYFGLFFENYIEQPTFLGYFFQS